MPSIGAVENTHLRDGAFKPVCSIISEELPHQTSTLPTKSNCNDCTRKGECESSMAPNKNGEVEADCKTPTPEQAEKASSLSSPHTEENGAASPVQESGCHGDKVMEETEGESNSENSQAHEEERDKVAPDPKTMSASEKREEFKNKRRASSVEILGLSKKYGPIRNQGSLATEIEEHFDHLMQRRKSSPARLGSRPAIFGDVVENLDESGLAAKMEKVSLSGESTEPRFGDRVLSETKSSELTAKGPTHPSLSYQRMAPYPKPTMYVQQQQHHGTIYQPVLSPSYPQSQVPHSLRPEGKKVAIPGMPSCRKVVTVYNTHSRGTVVEHTIDNMPRSQHNPQRLPTESEYIFPVSPTSDISSVSGGSPAPFSPDNNSMHTAPSPSQSQPSPSAMSTSPNSPYSLESAISPPPSVGSNISGDSGISSPPHENQFTTCTPTNSGTLICNPSVQPTHPDVIYPFDTQFLIRGQDDRYPVYSPPLSNDEECISNIAQALRTSADNYTAQTQGLHTGNQAYQQSQVAQQPVQQHIMPYMQPQPHPQQMPLTYSPPADPKDIVNNMPLDVLCGQDEDEDTALHIAISQGDENLCNLILKRLVESGRADALNIRDKLGQTPLYIAVVTNQPNLVFRLVLHGGDVMIANKEGSTPLHYAATKGYSHALTAIGCGLIEGNHTRCNINVENKNGMSPLHCAIQAHGRKEQVYDGNVCRYVTKTVDSVDTVKKLLGMYADPAFKDSRSGYSALHYAVELPPNPNVTSNLQIIEILLDSSNDAQELLAVSTYSSNTPLHLIAGRNYPESHIVSVIDLLIKYGAEITVKNEERQYPHDLVDKKNKPMAWSRLQGNHLQGK
ncbi:uncharacterized protein [Diadema antillarum]|uniref:uncharacterized protein n=1 Tax=Diadema antillarum TaxID=105358 RepID=UPI003A8B7B64